MRHIKRLGAAPRGRLLNEFLISLGLFFLILAADLTILNSASRSASQAGATREALDLAREGLEELVASPNGAARLLKEQSFASRSGSVEGFSFTRTVKVTPLTGPLDGLSEALITVDWGQGRTVRLERYVSKL